MSSRVRSSEVGPNPPVVITQSARAESFGDGLLNGRGGVGNRNLTLHGVTGVGQLPANPLLMGIQDSTQHELAAGGDDLDVHWGHVIADPARFQVEKWRRSGSPGSLSPGRAALKLAWSAVGYVFRSSPMKVDLGIWDRLSRLIILLLIVAAVLGVALWYLPVIQKNEKLRRDILNWDSKIEKELERSRRLTAELEAYRDPRSVERLARERLNYARPEELIIRFETPHTDEPSPTLKVSPVARGSDRHDLLFLVDEMFVDLRDELVG